MNRLQVRTEDGSLDGPAATASEVPNRRVLFSPYSVTARTRVLSFFLRSRFWPGPLAFSYVSIFISATFDSFFAPLRRFSIALLFFFVFFFGALVKRRPPGCIQKGTRQVVGEL